MKAFPPDLDIIVQARMGSTRLPGKTLMPMAGKPLLATLFRRLAAARCARRAVLATTESAKDDPIAAWAADNGVFCFRGSEDDVLSRYYHAAKALGSRHVMRVTADCPLVDPATCDELAALYLREGAAYARTSDSFPDGLDCEIFSFEALALAHHEARTKTEREHVTAYLGLHPERVPQVQLDCAENGADLRVTIDYPEDFEVARTVLEALGPADPLFSCRDIIRFLRENGELRERNAQYARDASYYEDLKRDGLTNKEGRNGE